MSKKVKGKETCSKDIEKNKDIGTQVGTPTMVLLPARNYYFKVSEEEYTITIPRSGKYSDIDPEFFKEEEGEFNLYDGRSKIMYMPAITKVLFATKKYPSLDANQLFAPLALVFKKNTVDIVGQIVEMLEPNKDIEGE